MMDDKLCKNCEHWDKDSVEPEYLKEMRHCENPIFHEGYTEIRNEETFNSGAVIENDEGWAWYVAPNFGCIHWVKS